MILYNFKNLVKINNIEKNQSFYYKFKKIIIKITILFLL
jgi:hypothetical protein